MKIVINAGLWAWCALAIGGFSPALAQTAADQSGSQLTEIIVTANKRAEREGDVAMSITAVSGARLDELGIHDVTDLQKVTPGSDGDDHVQQHPGVHHSRRWLF